MIKTQILEIGMNDKDEIVVKSQGREIYNASCALFDVHDLAKTMRTAIQDTYETGKLRIEDAERLTLNFSKLTGKWL